MVVSTHLWVTELHCYKTFELEKNEPDVVIDDIYTNIRQELFHYSLCEKCRLLYNCNKV